MKTLAAIAGSSVESLPSRATVRIQTVMLSSVEACFDMAFRASPGSPAEPSARTRSGADHYDLFLRTFGFHDDLLCRIFVVTQLNWFKGGIFFGSSQVQEK